MRDAKADLPAFNRLLAELPWPMNKTASVSLGAEALVKGIEGRQEHVYCPRWVGLMRWLKPVLSTRLGEAPLLKFGGELMPQLDAQVAALGRSTSSYTESLVVARRT